MAALLACIGLTWTAGATSAFATYGQVKITKVNEGGDQADLFKFTGSRALASTAGFDLKGGQSYPATGYKNVLANAGAYAGNSAYYVSENADADYNLRDIDCSVTPAPGKYTASGSTTKDLASRKVTIRVGLNEKADCTFYNKRKTGTLVVKKALVPSTDTGKFDLQIDGTTVAAQVGDGGYGTKTVTTGTHTVGETGAYLSSYSSATACENAAGAAVAVSAAGAVNVGDGDTITCTITNTRKTGTIVVTKALIPATDAGRFDLQVDGDNVATQVGDGGTGSKVVPTGSHTVGEAGASLGDYTSSIACRNGTYTVAVSAAGALDVGSGDTIVCTITNTRKTGTIVVTKALIPATDAGRFDLQVDGDNVATQVGDGGTGSKTVPTGDHTVGEAGSTLGDYASSTSCTDAAGSEVAQGSGDVTVTVGDGDTITCTITNTRKVKPTPPSSPQPPVTPSTPQPAPAQAVAGVKTAVRPARGSAALTGPRACPRTTSVSATVRGKQIRRVTFFLRGHKVKTVTKAAGGRWTLTMRTSSLRRGPNAVTARVEFAAASQTKARTLRINITRCAARFVSPRFTG